jgi:Trp operon repressor
MFDYYQAIFLLLTQMKEEESITLLLALFTDADHKEYVTILNIINDVLSGKHLL